MEKAPVPTDSLATLVATATAKAFEQADEALHNTEVPIGCSILDRSTGSLVAWGRNRTNESRNATRHAEIEALDMLKRGSPSMQPPYRNLALVVTIEPCIMCIMALRMAGITSVYFGASNERFGGCGSIIRAHTGEYHAEVPEAKIVMLGEEWRRRAVMLLRRFYLTENARAPKPRKKANRKLKDI